MRTCIAGRPTARPRHLRGLAARRRLARLVAGGLLLAVASFVGAAAVACGEGPGAPTPGGATDVPSAEASAGGADVSVSPPATPVPAAPEARLMKERLLLLQGYIETYALEHYYIYPTVAGVRRDGALVAPLWPADPWTGRPLRPGDEPGTYTYTVTNDRRRYRLTGHLPGGDYELKGAMPGSGRTAYRHREMEGLSLIRQYVIEWARRHGGLYPPASEVSREGGVGALRAGGLWPSNPWNHGPMTQSDAVGDFAYAVAADRSWCRLSLHVSPTADWTLDCPTAGTAADAPTD